MPYVYEPDIPESWVLSQEPSGAWRALINLHGSWVQLGYFGAREDAEETIAACFQPSQASRPEENSPPA